MEEFTYEQHISRYSLDELRNLKNRIDQDRFPERYELVLKEIEKRKLHGESVVVASERASSTCSTNSWSEVEETQATTSAGIVEPLPVTHELPLAFQCTAREYFRIWSVNLCLSLLTLGIFSAWAKVRKKRYFYSHITLDGTPFQYLGQPLPILKGRIVAVIMFLIYYLANNFFTSLLSYVLFAGMLLAPWVIVRSAAFNARYSAYRNMTFSYHGNYLSAVLAIYWLGLIPIIVIGTIFSWWGNLYIAGILYGLFALCFPWLIKRLKHLIVNHTVFGGIRGKLSVSGGQFFRVYFISSLILIGIGILAGILGSLLRNFSVNFGAEITLMFFLIPIYIGYVISYAYVQAHSSNIVWNQTRLGPIRFQSTLTATGLGMLYVSNALAILISLGLLIPWAVIRTLKYRIDNMHVLCERNLSAFISDDRTAVEAAGSELGEFFDLDLSL